MGRIEKNYYKFWISENGEANISTYNTENCIFLSMKLANFDQKSFLTESIIDEREGGISALLPVDFFYRGLCVPGIQSYNKIVYPCWNIRAFAFYGEAEKIVTISRNHLLPDAEFDAKKRITKVADDALEVLFNRLLNIENNIRFIVSDSINAIYNEIDIIEKEKNRLLNLTQGRMNALALSLIYYLMTSNFEKRTHRLFDDKKAIDRIKLLISLSSIKLPVIELEYDRAYIKNMPLSYVFGDNPFSVWYISARDMPLVESVAKLVDPINNFNNIIVQDIFSDYLFERDSEASVAVINALEMSNDYNTEKKENLNYHTSFIYGFSNPTVLKSICDENTYRKIILKVINDAIKFRNNDKYSDAPNPNDYPVIPAVRDFIGLALPRLRERDKLIHKELLAFGSYFLVPFTYNEIYSYINTKKKDKDKHKSLLSKIYYHTVPKTNRQNDFSNLIEFVYNAVKNKWDDKNSFKKRYYDESERLLKDINTFSLGM